MEIFNATIALFDSWTLDRRIDSNCTVEVEGDLPSDFFTQEQRLQGAIVVHIVIGIYCFTLLAVIVNDFFLPAVECIVKALNLSEVRTIKSFVYRSLVGV